MKSDDTLMHYGVGHDKGGHSGRYPWGSGDDPYQHEPNSFADAYRQLRKQGMTDKEIADAWDLKSVAQLKAKYSISKDEEKAALIRRAREMSAQGMSNVAIAKELGTIESNIRNWIKDDALEKRNATKEVSKTLSEIVGTKGMIDVGPGAELELGVTRNKLDVAVAMLEEQGYSRYNIKVEQLGTGKQTTISVLAPPGVTWTEAYNNRFDIKSLADYEIDNGKTKMGLLPPENLSADRVMVRYAEDGGKDKDGVIELRKGVEDISLGASSYAQVRIAVDGTHYLKGMAMYGPDKDFPPGVDVIFNTNKTKDVPMMGTGDATVLKKMKKDPDNPFGATINAQRLYDDPNGTYVDPITGKKQSLSVINKVNEEGAWGEWAKKLPSQMLSKQQLPLIERQLELSYVDKKAQFDEIMAVTNPAVKQKLLREFADLCDGAAVDLKAAALPRQGAHVILPITSISETEIYAPNYRDGEHVVLIRYPHAGTFEIPELVVNNKHAEAKSLLGNAIDAVGINSKVAERLSGADFDGDTVMVIPVNSRVRIKTSPALAELKNFDPNIYALPESAPRMSSKTKQTEMGKVSNLITDMTLLGAPQDEIARAVKHSMVVIDAEKHHLDYKQSEIDNGIKDLKEKWQGGRNAGASTIISRAKSKAIVPERKTRIDIDPDTGEKIFIESGRTYIDKKTGKEKVATQDSTKMAEAKNAFDLVSETRNPIEVAYAKYANSLKALANQSRKELVSTPNQKYSPSAKETYSAEVASLNAKLNEALKNAPRERQAQLIANQQVALKKADNPDMDNDELKKKKNQALSAAREKFGAKKSDVEIKITDKEWEAIQAGAISHSKLLQILDNTDMDTVRDRATPKESRTVSNAEESRIRQMKVSGYTISEIADALGFSTSTVSKYLK